MICCIFRDQLNSYHSLLVWPKTKWRLNLKFLSCTKLPKIWRPNVSSQVVWHKNITKSLAFVLGCDIPLSEADNGIKFAASSYELEREPYRARLSESKAWCAKAIVKYAEYLQVNLSSLRHVSAIELQGAKWSFMEYFVKTFLVSYSIDGKKYKFYKSKSGSKSMVNYT